MPVLNAKTMAQIPRTAADYYDAVERDVVFVRVQIGTDDAGRRVFQTYLNGERFGGPKALLGYREYAAAVRGWAVHPTSGGIGVGRWTEPYFSDIEPTSEWTAEADRVRAEFEAEMAVGEQERVDYRLLSAAIG